MYSLVIIDDEQEQLNGLATFFPWEKNGFSVTRTFTDGRTALAYLENHQTDVVFTDIRMPFISGLDVIKTLSGKAHTPLFCIMSAYDEFGYAQEAMRYGVQDYLVKPASFDEITSAFAKIRAVLDERQVIVPTQHPHQENPLVNQAIAIMEKRTATASLQDVADELGLNISYLSRLFKEKTGKNFQAFLLELKMSQAEMMLKGDVPYTNTDIAKALGYQDTQNFCRTFKRIHGVSPQSFRKQT